MAIIPGGQQIRTTSADVDLTPRGNALVKAQNQVYTMDDIVETVNAEGGGPSYKVLTGFWQYDEDDLEQNEPTLTVLYNDTGATITPNRQFNGYYFFDVSGTGIEGSGHLISTQVVGSGSESRLIVNSIEESGGNVIRFTFFAYAPDNTSLGKDTHGEKVYFELRVY